MCRTKRGTRTAICALALTGLLLTPTALRHAAPAPGSTVALAAGPAAGGPNAGRSPYYKWDIIAESGQNGLTGIGQEPSINSDGKVAFVGDLAGGLQGLYVGDGSGSPMNINPMFVQSGLSYGQAVQINDHDQVVAQDSLVGPYAAANIRVWNADVLNASSDVAGTEFAADLPFDTIFSNPSINNTQPPGNTPQNQVVFSGIDSEGASKPALATVNQDPDNYNLTLLNDPLRPLIADPGQIVVRQGNTATSPIVLYDYGLAHPQTIASIAGGQFSALGESPGISDDGKVVAFYGVLTGPGATTLKTNPGPGIFAYINDGVDPAKIIRVAGIPAELGYDAAAGKLQFSSFSADTRVAVEHQSLGGQANLVGDSFVVAFIATPNAASRPNPATGTPLLFSNQQGLWTVRVDVQNQLAAPATPPVYHPTGPIKVAQLGDMFDGHTLNGLYVNDPLANAPKNDGHIPRTQHLGDHRIAFWASATDGTQLLLRGSHLDSSGDGILDHWKTDGLDIDGDGDVDLDLKAMGAKVGQRDIFVEMDWLTPQIDGLNNHTNEPAPNAIQDLVDMFALADGVAPPYTLHVDAGSGISVNMGSGDLNGGGRIEYTGPGGPHLDVVYFGKPGSVAAPPEVPSESFQQIKDQYFLSADDGARELAFHYMVLADFHGFIDDATGKPFISTVTAATANTLTSAAALPAGLSGAWVKIYLGTGAGQYRRITASTSMKLTVSPAWGAGMIPAAGSSFALLDGSTGQGEIAIQPNPDNNATPGNDVVLSLRGAGINADGWLGNECIQWRTMAHELGHNLGLRHGGIDNTKYRDGKPPPPVPPPGGYNYASLMSYSWQLQCPSITGAGTSPIQSYAGAYDNTFDDWTHLRPDFQNSDIFLGNSYDLGPGGAPIIEQPEQTIADFVAINGALPDLTPPTLTINSPLSGQSIGVGTTLLVTATASDNIGVHAVNVSFDTNGDGNTTDCGETVAATTVASNTFTAAFPYLSGPGGARTITATALDGSGNSTIVTRTITVTGQSATLSVSPAGGVYNGSATVTGTQFRANEPVNLYWDCAGTAPLATTTTDAAGSFSAAITVPQAISGTHTIVAVGQASRLAAAASFQVQPSATLPVAAGGQGAAGTLLGYGFAPTETVTAYWGQQGGLPLGLTTSNALGSFGGTSALTFTVPLSPTGTYNIVAVGQSSGAVVTNTFTVLPSVSIAPSGGSPGSGATVAGTGFGANEQVTVKWDCASPTCSSTTILGTATTDASGSFSGLAVGIPTAVAGAHTIGALGGTSGTFYSATYTVAPSVSVAPSGGIAGSTATVTGIGFAAGEPVTVTWDCTAPPCSGAPVLGTATTDANGTFNGLGVTIPATARVAAHTIAVTGGTSGAFAGAFFDVTASVSVVPATGSPGSTATVSGTGFMATEPITVTWDCTRIPCTGKTVLVTTTTDTSGSFSGLGVTIPATATAGTHTIGAVGRYSGAFYTAPYTVTPSLSIAPASGAQGSTATVAGKGYGANEMVTVAWDCAAAPCSGAPVLGTATTDANGTFSGLSATIPSASLGTHAIGGTGGTSGAFAGTTYTVTS